MLMLYPIVFVVGRSFMEDTYLAKNPLVLLPTDFSQISMKGYEFIFNKQAYIMNSYLVTVSRTVIGTACSMVFTICMAYVLSKKRYPGRMPLTLFVVFTMWFGGGLIPYFLLIRGLGLFNNFAVYIIPGLISA